MAATFSAFIPLPVAALAFVTLGSCGDGRSKTGAGGTDVQATHLISEDFKGVCSGASVSAAKAYDPKATAHKALYFASFNDDFADQSTSLPDDWTAQYSSGDDPLKADPMRAVDLVVCARRTATPLLKICDGYENNGKPTQNKVRWHAATYELSVREAKTGRTLAEKAVEAKDSGCPMFETFGSDTDTVDDYPRLSDSIVADFLKPHITG